MMFAYTGAYVDRCDTNNYRGIMAPYVAIRRGTGGRAATTGWPNWRRACQWSFASDRSAGPTLASPAGQEVADPMLVVNIEYQ